MTPPDDDPGVLTGEGAVDCPGEEGLWSVEVGAIKGIVYRCGMTSRGF